MVGITAKLKPAGKKGFFDTTEVMKALGRARYKIFNDYGRLVRKRALASILYSDKPGDKPGPPGTPPHAHRSRKRKLVSKSTGKTRVRAVSFLREFLWYKYDTETQSVVVGPEKLNKAVAAKIPHVLEYGGTSQVKDHGKLVSVQIHPHPFMHPAAAEEAKALPSMWRDSVR
jgi:hypothetical protein